MYYPDELVEEIREKNDVVSVIGEYVKLTRKGGSYFGLCPFHNEKTPSFSVSPQKGIFHCFGCGEGGNVIHFLMKIENISFEEAVYHHESGVDVLVRGSNTPKIELFLESEKLYSFNNNIRFFSDSNNLPIPT